MQLRLLTNWRYTDAQGQPQLAARGTVADAESLGGNVQALLACGGAEVVLNDPAVLPTFPQMVAAIEADPALLDQLKAHYGASADSNVAVGDEEELSAVVNAESAKTAAVDEPAAKPDEAKVESQEISTVGRLGIEVRPAPAKSKDKP